MPVNEQLANRVREIIAASGQPLEEKKMFSGLAFLVNGKICVGVSKERMLVRLAPELFEPALEMEGVNPMVRNGKAMTGYVYVDVAMLSTQKQLKYWMKLALDFNPLAKAAAKKKGAAKKTQSAKKK